jgi:uncharacterized coiled-coil protein SlyX
MRLGKRCIPARRFPVGHSKTLALAAIQGLNEKLAARSETLDAENAELKARLEKLEQMTDARGSPQ